MSGTIQPGDTCTVVSTAREEDNTKKIASLTGRIVLIVDEKPSSHGFGISDPRAPRVNPGALMGLARFSLVIDKRTGRIHRILIPGSTVLGPVSSKDWLKYLERYFGEEGARWMIEQKATLVADESFDLKCTLMLAQMILPNLNR